MKSRFKKFFRQELTPFAEQNILEKLRLPIVVFYAEKIRKPCFLENFSMRVFFASALKPFLKLKNFLQEMKIFTGTALLKSAFFRMCGKAVSVRKKSKNKILWQ